ENTRSSKPGFSKSTRTGLPLVLIGGFLSPGTWTGRMGAQASIEERNKARRVLSAGPEEAQDEEKETNDYSDGTAKLPMKELRLSGLLQVDPRPWPLKSWASA